ncbi:hypothetical protein Pcinc_023128 [Petrolisthes cinctipes]|uniref:Hexosyltransferase n=1 Tax=Petrolisthes cinctipes TaxID=88211 RepID=A0AAE1FDS1_PETCI|nr:hypothetical protein Pcinc_023128 [Petrolisthes cinctipes]
MLPRIKSLNRYSGRFLGRLLLVMIATGVLTAQMYIILGTKEPGNPLPLSPRQVQQFLKNKMHELKPRTQENELPIKIMDFKGEELYHDIVKMEPQNPRLITTLPPTAKKLTLSPTKAVLQPQTFIPDQPDTSPLARPPDIPKRFLIEEADFCHRQPGLQIIAYVHTSIKHVRQRNETRYTWGSASAYDLGDISVKIGVVFMVGRAKDELEELIIQEESQRYHDIVQGDYGDHYRLLTYKGLAGLYWISRHCAHVPWTLHSDDDTHIDIFLYHRALKELDNESKEKFICSFMYGPVLRSSKWKVRYEEYPADEYPLYCSGGVWFLQTKLVPKLLEATKSVNFLWVDDAYITGLLPKKAGIKHLPFQAYYGGPKPKLERLGKEVAWFVKFVSRWDWWNIIVEYHRNNSMHNPATLLPQKTDIH